MKIIISADGRKLCASTGGQPLTSGSVGIEAAFVLSADYDGLAVTAVFRAGDVSVDVLLTGPSCTVPWEVLQTSGHVLVVGVVGKNGSGEIVIPTIWGRVGMVECGTVAEGIDPQDPTPDIAAQLLQIAQATVERAETAETTATEAAEAAGESATAAGEAKTDAETATQDAEAARQAIEDLSVEAHKDPDGPSVEKTVDPETGAVTLDFGIPPAPEVPVQSVNGKTGAVQLTLDDIPDGTDYTRTTLAQVQQIGTNADDIEQLKTDVAKKYEKPNTGIPKTDLAAGVKASLDKADTALQPAALQPYRTAAAQDVIDNAQDDRLDDLEQATTSATVGPAPIVTFDASAADMLLKQVLVNIEPVQAGSGDPSPENIRPISGWTGCNVTRAGENLYDGATLSPNKSFSDDNGTTVNSTVSDIVQNIDVLGGETYIFSFDYVSLKAVNARRCMWYDAGNNPIVGRYTYTPSEKNAIFTAPLNAVKLSITVDKGCFDFQLYLQRDVTTKSITFPTEAGTVYGGTLELPSCVLKVDRAGYAFNGTEDGWTKSSAYGGSFFRSWINIPSGSGITAGAFTCSHAGYVPNFSEYAYGKCGSDSALNLWVIQGPDATIADFKAFLAEQYANGTPVTVCYTLATPIEITLTHTQMIETLLGQNNIWADCGDVTVTYGAYLETLKASLDRTNGELGTLRICIAPIENGATASKAYAAGAYFFRNGSFCTALTAISSGAVFTLGTNYQATTVAAALTNVKIILQPLNVTATIGADTTFLVVAENAASFQWQVSRDGGATWANSTITGYLTPQLKVKAESQRNGYMFRCRITGNSGDVVISNGATLTITE